MQMKRSFFCQFYNRAFLFFFSSSAFSIRVFILSILIWQTNIFKCVFLSFEVLQTEWKEEDNKKWTGEVIEMEIKSLQRQTKKSIAYENTEW